MMCLCWDHLLFKDDTQEVMEYIESIIDLYPPNQ